MKAARLRPLGVELQRAHVGGLRLRGAAGPLAARAPSASAASVGRGEPRLRRFAASRAAAAGSGDTAWAIAPAPQRLAQPARRVRLPGRGHRVGVDARPLQTLPPPSGPVRPGGGRGGATAQGGGRGEQGDHRRRFADAGTMRDLTGPPRPRRPPCRRARRSPRARRSGRGCRRRRSCRAAGGRGAPSPGCRRAPPSPPRDSRRP